MGTEFLCPAKQNNLLHLVHCTLCKLLCSFSMFQQDSSSVLCRMFSFMTSSKSRDILWRLSNVQPLSREAELLMLHVPLKCNQMKLNLFVTRKKVT